MKYAGGLEQEDRQHLWHWVENMGFHVAVQLPLWGEQVGQGSLMGQLSVQCLHLYNIWHLMSVLGHRDRTWSRDLCETVWTSPTRPSYPTLNLGLLVSGLGSSALQCDSVRDRVLRAFPTLHVHPIQNTSISAWDVIYYSSSPPLDYTQNFLK